MGILVALIAVVIKIYIPPRSKFNYKDVFFFFFLFLHFHLGWGKIKHPGSSHNILQQAQMPPVTNSECARKLAASPGTRLKSFFYYLFLSRLASLERSITMTLCSHSIVGQNKIDIRSMRFPSRLMSETFCYHV